MRPLSVLPVVALILIWALALWLWPDLPERIPLHFDGAGRPDRFGDKTLLSWFGLPTLATVFALVFAFVLPPWIVSLARRNSKYLNVPDRAQFEKLPPEARVRATRPVTSMLIVLATEITLLFGVIQYGTARVASGAWEKLPTAMVFGALGILVATSLLWLPFVGRGVRNEVQRART